MTAVDLDFGSATAAGLDVDPVNDTALTLGRATAAGYPILVLGAAPTVSDVPDALRLEIVTSDGTQLVNDLTRRRNLSFTVEHNGSGSVSFETDLDAFADGLDDAALDPSNLVRVHFGDLPDWPFGVAEGYVAAAPPAKNDDGSWSLQVSCPGSWDVLDFGVLWPPAGSVGDTRDFNYNAGLTREVPAWATPVGVNVKKSYRWRENRWPRGWPESDAQWIWSSSPEKPSPNGKRRFVGQFTITGPRNVRFFLAGDDSCTLYLNGAVAKSKPKDAWHTTAAFTRSLPAGTHVLTAAVANQAGTNNRSGFLLAVGRLDGDGKVDKWLLRTNPTNFKYLSEATVAVTPVGWFPPAVLHQQVEEAAARGVDFHDAIELTFTETADSAGTAWTVKGPVEYEIGISGAALGDKIRSLAPNLGGADMAMLPGLRLSAWRSRGFDLRDRVVISKANRVGWSARTWSRVRTAVLTHQESGWSETDGTDLPSQPGFGRREMTMSGGGVDGDAQADALAYSAVATSASTEETIEAEITSADLRAGAPQPFRDFDVADTVLMETVGGFTPVKVMSISGAEQDDKSVKFTIAGYPV